MSIYTDVIIAGFGGQGIMLIGNLLAYAGMEATLKVTFIPVYGPEMRGGTANCTVVISDEEIGSPIIRSPQSLIIMNQPSLVKFLPGLSPNGLLIYNSSLVEIKNMQNKEQGIIEVPANQIADSLGNTKMANMVALGAYIQAIKIIPLGTVQNSLNEIISAHYSHLIELNTKALVAGAEYAEKQLP